MDYGSHPQGYVPPRSQSETSFTPSRSPSPNPHSDDERPGHTRNVSIDRHRRGNTFTTLRPIGSQQRLDFPDEEKNHHTVIPLNILLDGDDSQTKMDITTGQPATRHNRSSSLPAAMRDVPPPPPLPAEYRSSPSSSPYNSNNTTPVSTPGGHLSTQSEIRIRARSASPLRISRKSARDVRSIRSQPNVGQISSRFGPVGGSSDRGYDSADSAMHMPAQKIDFSANPYARTSPFTWTDKPRNIDPEAAERLRRAQEEETKESVLTQGNSYHKNHVLAEYSSRKHAHEIPTHVLYNAQFSPKDDGWRTTKVSRSHHQYSATTPDGGHVPRTPDGGTTTTAGGRHDRSKSTLERFKEHDVRPHAFDHYHVRHPRGVSIASQSSVGGGGAEARYGVSVSKSNFSEYSVDMGDDDDDVRKLDTERRQFDREAMRSYACRSCITVFFLYAEMFTNIYLLVTWFLSRHYGWFAFGLTIVIPPFVSQLTFIWCHVIDGTFSCVSCLSSFICAHHCVFLLEAIAHTYDLDAENWVNMLRSFQGFPSLMFMIMKQYIAMAAAFGVVQSCDPNRVPCSNVVLYFSLIFSLCFYVCTLMNRGVFFMTATAKRFKNDDDIENVHMHDVYFGEYEPDKNYFNFLSPSKFHYPLFVYCICEMLHRTISIVYIMVLILQFGELIPAWIICGLVLICIYSMYACVWASIEETECCFDWCWPWCKPCFWMCIGCCMAWTECLSAFISVYAFFNGSDKEEPWRKLTVVRARISFLLCLTMFIFMFFRAPPFEVSARFAKFEVVLWALVGMAAAVVNMVLIPKLPSISVKKQLELEDVVVGNGYRRRDDGDVASDDGTNRDDDQMSRGTSDFERR